MHSLAFLACLQSYAYLHTAPEMGCAHRHWITNSNVPLCLWRLSRFCTVLSEPFAHPECPIGTLDS